MHVGGCFLLAISSRLMLNLFPITASTILQLPNEMHQWEHSSVTELGYRILLYMCI